MRLMICTCRLLVVKAFSQLLASQVKAVKLSFMVFAQNIHFSAVALLAKPRKHINGWWNFHKRRKVRTHTEENSETETEVQIG